jgi:methionyl-tRNA formyltransferase
MIVLVTSGLKIAVATHGSEQFEFLREMLTKMGHVPVAYLLSRSVRPSEPPNPGILEVTQTIVADLPLGMDLLLPGGPGAVASMLAGYQPDLLLVYGFNWHLPREVLELPRLGVLNVHPSALPKYRGREPLLWAIRNGDPFMGVTIHRMNERIDTGPIFAQAADIPVPDEVTSQDVWDLTRAALPGLLAEALDAAVRGDPGTPQDEREATYAGFPPPEWYDVTWQGDRRNLHNQIRVLRYLNQGQGPVVIFQDEIVQVHRTSLTADGGVPIECADGPLWVTCTPAS